MEGGGTAAGASTPGYSGLVEYSWVLGAGEYPVTQEGESKEEYWARLTKLSPYETVEQLRDQIDRRNWREVEARQRLAEQSRGEPPREVPGRLGRISGRPTRQVNVKLAPGDFDGLVALAIDRDLPPASMARLLLRRAILDAMNDA